MDKDNVNSFVESVQLSLGLADAPEIVVWLIVIGLPVLVIFILGLCCICCCHCREHRTSKRAGGPQRFGVITSAPMSPRSRHHSSTATATAAGAQQGVARRPSRRMSSRRSLDSFHGAAEAAAAGGGGGQQRLHRRQSSRREPLPVRLTHQPSGHYYRVPRQETEVQLGDLPSSPVIRLPPGGLVKQPNATDWAEAEAQAYKKERVGGNGGGAVVKHSVTVFAPKLGPAVQKRVTFDNDTTVEKAVYGLTQWVATEFPDQQRAWGLFQPGPGGQPIKLNDQDYLINKVKHAGDRLLLLAANAGSVVYSRPDEPCGLCQRPGFRFVPERGMVLCGQCIYQK